MLRTIRKDRPLLRLMMAYDPKKVLVLCTGNSCRSVMAEALINQLAKGRFKAFSAGSSPVGCVHPKTIETLKRHGIDPRIPQSKSWDVFATEPFDLVITVCDQAAGETCPVFPGKPKKLHWSIPDPAKAEGSEAEIDAAFDQALYLLKYRVEDLIK
jgi:arsenate reductase (thioredoxin)